MKPSKHSKYQSPTADEITAYNATRTPKRLLQATGFVSQYRTGPRAGQQLGMHLGSQRAIYGVRS